MSKKVLVTGAAGFLGMFAVKNFLSKGYHVVGIDDLNDFTYDAKIKIDRLQELGIDGVSLAKSSYKKNGNFEFHLFDITDMPTMEAMILDGNFDLIVHLASLSSTVDATLSPSVFIKANVNGFTSILEGLRCLKGKRPYLIYSSSASVYGDSKEPLVENDKNLVRPKSIYALTKQMMEDLASVYANLYGIKSVGLRLFNIIGPMMRPNTLVYKLAKSLSLKESFDLYDNGENFHDFMDIDDFIRCLNLITEADTGLFSSSEIFNIASLEKKKVSSIVQKLESLSSEKLIREDIKTPLGDCGNFNPTMDKFNSFFNFKIEVSFDASIEKFYKWFLEYVKTSNNFYQKL